MTTPSSLLPGHPFIHYRANKASDQGHDLYVEDVSVHSLAKAYGTPLFVYSKAAILHALADYQQGFAGRRSRICYSVKANSSLAILQTLAHAGCGFDIVSAGELARVLAAGGKPEQVIFSGVGKTRAEMRTALEVGIACFNVESLPEIDVLNQVALDLGVCAPISIRVNPDVDAQTHPYISTGLRGNKFGIAHDQAVQAYCHAANLPGLKVVGIDCHIGSQITQITPYLDTVERLLDLVQAIESHGIVLEHLDFGGGLGIRYQEETPPQAKEIWAQMLARMDARGYGQRLLIVEPGRSLVGNAGLCVTEVLYLKPGTTKNFCIVDAAMNDLPRPAMYQAYHAIVPVQRNQQTPDTVYDVVGPVCESGDWIGHERALPVTAGDHLAVLSAGAYCMSMASQYNTRALAAEVMVDGARHHLIRPRQPVAEIFQNEKLLNTADGEGL